MIIWALRVGRLTRNDQHRHRVYLKYRQSVTPLTYDNLEAYFPIQVNPSRMHASEIVGPVVQSNASTARFLYSS